MWLLPVVTLIVASSSGGVFAPEIHKYSPEHALITTSVSVFMVSIGLSLALMILTMYLFRLIVHGLPPPASIVSVFLPLGPTGQAGYSILLTGQYFRDALPFGSSAFLGSPSTGYAIYAMCVGVSFVLWSLCTMWTVFALLSVQHVARRSSIPFKVQTWGLIFPNVKGLLIFMIVTKHRLGCLCQPHLSHGEHVRLWLLPCSWLDLCCCNINHVDLRRMENRYTCVWQADL